MERKALKIAWIDARQDDVGAKIAALREKLSLKGNIVSEAGKQRTIEIFGAPLTPAEVVAKICDDVAEKGIDALLDYSERVDRAKLTHDQLRVSEEELQRALTQVEPEFLESVERVA